MDTQHGRPCSLAAALGLVGDRWALLAVREVMFGNHRFSQIARNTAAPRDRLAARLKALVDAGSSSAASTSPAAAARLPSHRRGAGTRARDARAARLG